MSDLRRGCSSYSPTANTCRKRCGFSSTISSSAIALRRGRWACQKVSSAAQISGFPFAALCCEMPRESRGVRERFTAGVRGMIGLLSGRMDSGLKQRQRDDRALATVASLVGALVLARAVNDPKLSDDILRATKDRLEA